MIQQHGRAHPVIPMRPIQLHHLVFKIASGLRRNHGIALAYPVKRIAENHPGIEHHHQLIHEPWKSSKKAVVALFLLARSQAAVEHHSNQQTVHSKNGQLFAAARIPLLPGDGAAIGKLRRKIDFFTRRRFDVGKNPAQLHLPVLLHLLSPVFLPGVPAFLHFLQGTLGNNHLLLHHLVLSLNPHPQGVLLVRIEGPPLNARHVAASVHDVFSRFQTALYHKRSQEKGAHQRNSIDLTEKRRVRPNPPKHLPDPPDDLRFCDLLYFFTHIFTFTIRCTNS